MTVQTPTTKPGPNLRRFVTSDDDILQLVLITALVFVVMSALSPDKFLRYYNFESISFTLPELGLLSIAIMVAMLTGGIDLSVVGIANLAAVLAGTLVPPSRARRLRVARARLRSRSASSWRWPPASPRER